MGTADYAKHIAAYAYDEMRRKAFGRPVITLDGKPMMSESFYQPSLDTLTSSDTVLDLGCGTGFFTEKLLIRNPRMVVGIDPNDANLAIAAKNLSLSIPFVQGVGEAIPLRNGTIDKVVSYGLVFHYFLSQEEALGEISRVLTPHGRYMFDAILSGGNETQSPFMKAIIQTYREFTNEDFYEMPNRVEKNSIENLALGTGFMIDKFREWSFLVSPELVRDQAYDMFGSMEAKLRTGNNPKISRFIDLLGRNMETHLREYENEEPIVGKLATVELVKKGH